MRAGDAVPLVLAAANRDPARFPEPDALVLDRPDRRDVALGQGFHYCLGAHWRGWRAGSPCAPSSISTPT